MRYWALAETAQCHTARRKREADPKGCELNSGQQLPQYPKSSAERTASRLLRTPHDTVIAPQRAPRSALHPGRLCGNRLHSWSRLSWPPISQQLKPRIMPLHFSLKLKITPLDSTENVASDRRWVQLELAQAQGKEKCSNLDKGNPSFVFGFFVFLLFLFFLSIPLLLFGPGSYWSFLDYIPRSLTPY